MREGHRLRGGGGDRQTETEAERLRESGTKTE